MSDLSKKIQSIIDDVKTNVTGEDNQEFVIKKLMELSVEYVKIINQINEKIDNIANIQDSMVTKVNKIQESVSGIENDIYEDGYDFDIVCPYCNTEFVADINSKSDIKCPECQNVIELDWNDEEEISECSGHCSSCSSKCGESWLDDEEDDEYNNDNDEEDDC